MDKIKSLQFAFRVAINVLKSRNYSRMQRPYLLYTTVTQTIAVTPKTKVFIKCGLLFLPLLVGCRLMIN